MKKTRPKTATNRTNESWNNKNFPIIPKQTNQTNKNFLSHRNSNKNIIDPNDSFLNKEFSTLINYWNDLGVTNEFRNQFKNLLSPLSDEEKEIIIENEMKNLNKFREILIKFTNDVTQREKNIQLLRKFEEIVESTFPEGDQQLNDSILNDIINVIEALRYNSINCVNSLLKVRELSYYKSLNGKFNFNKMNKAYIYNNDYLIKMKNDMNFLRNSYLGNYIDFTNGDIDPFLICCSPKKNSRNRRQDKITIPINDELMKRIKQAKYYFIQDMMFFNIDEDKKNNKNNISFNFYNYSNSGFNNLYRSNNNNFINNNNINNFTGKNSFISKTSRINSAKSRIDSSFNKSGNNINLNNLNMNRTLYKLKVINGEEKYNLMFLNGEQNFYKHKHFKNNMNQSRSNYQVNNYQNNNYIYDKNYNENLSNNRIRIEREQIPSMSRDEFLKRLDSIGKDREEQNIDHSMSDYIEKNKKNDKKKTKEEDFNNKKEEKKSINENNEKIDNENENKNDNNNIEKENENKDNFSQNKEEIFEIVYGDQENKSEIEEYQNEFENEEKEKENENKLKSKKQNKNEFENEESKNDENEEKEEKKEEENEEENEDYGGFEEVKSDDEFFETNKDDYNIEYYKDDINNLIRILSEKNYFENIPENEKELFNLSEESFYPNNLIKGLYPKILICYPKNENNENITALCNYSFSSLDKPITILINHLSSINYNDDNNSWASQIEKLINYITNNTDYDIIEINFNDIDNLDKDMKKLFINNLNFEIDEKNKKLIYKNPNSENEKNKQVNTSRYLSIKTASLISYSNNISTNQFNNDKYINLFQIYCILNEKNKLEQFSLNDIGNKGLLIDIEEVKNSLKNNIIFSLNNKNLKSIKEFIQEKISNDINFEYLEYNGKDESDIILYNNIPPLRSGISIKLNKVYYNRIEDKLEILYDKSSNSKIYLIPTYDNETKIIIAELNKGLKKKIIEKNGNIYENFYDLYDKLVSDKDNNSIKTIYIPSFSLESRLYSSHIVNIENNINIINNKNNNSLYINSVDEFFEVNWFFEMNLNNNFPVKTNKNDIIINDMFLFGVFNEKLWDINRIPATQLYIITKDFWNKSN